VAEPLRRAIGLVAGLNGIAFGAEVAVALAIGSVALFADSVDFAEDAAVNVLVLVGLAWTARRRATLAMALSGILLLPMLGFAYGLYQKALAPAVPDAGPLALTGAAALVVNLACALILAKHRRSGGSLVRVAFLSARNDVAANVAIVAAGLVTAAWPTIWPDIVVGLAIAVMNVGAMREVWQAARSERAAADQPRP
jgi:Co/Zn/Cd efflux system component